MLLPNNPDLDPAALAEKLNTIAQYRRRSEPLFVTHQAQVSVPGMSALQAEPLTMKERVRLIFAPGVHWKKRIALIPLLGPIALAGKQRLRQLQSPSLSWKQRLMLIPLVGGLAHWIFSIVRLTAIRRQMAEDMLQLKHQCQLLRLELNQLQQRQQIEQLDNRHAMEQLRLADVQVADRVHAIERFDSPNRFRQVETVLENLKVLDTEHANRLAELKQAFHRIVASMQTAPVSAGASAVPPSSRTPSDFDLNNFFSEFETRFRGTRQDILGRLRVYLPHVSRFAGDPAAQVIDIGCGRGEWLELMQQQGIQAVGVDLNEIKVQECRDLGFAAECADAVAYLRGLKEGSVAAVTGFHIIEHLPFELLLEIFDAALHALRPDGLIIFETPNPENLIVGACNFYYDPTHLHPIVPAVAEFIAQQRGFAHAEILRLHPFGSEQMVQEDSEAARKLNQAFFGPQDYAVLAWKTRHAH